MTKALPDVESVNVNLPAASTIKFLPAPHNNMLQDHVHLNRKGYEQ